MVIRAKSWCSTVMSEKEMCKSEAERLDSIEARLPEIGDRLKNVEQKMSGLLRSRHDLEMKIDKRLDDMSKLIRELAKELGMNYDKDREAGESPSVLPATEHRCSMAVSQSCFKQFHSSVVFSSNLSEAPLLEKFDPDPQPIVKVRMAELWTGGFNCGDDIVIGEMGMGSGKANTPLLDSPKAQSLNGAQKVFEEMSEPFLDFPKAQSLSSAQKVFEEMSEPVIVTFPSTAQQNSPHCHHRNNLQERKVEPMAEKYDWTARIAPQLGRHLVFKLLEFLQERGLYLEEDIHKAKIELLNHTNMVDSVMDVHKFLYCSDDVPKEMVDRRAEVVGLKALKEGAAPLIAFLHNPNAHEGSDRTLYEEWVLKTISDTWNLFDRKFTALWDKHKDDPGDAYLPEVYNNPKLQSSVKQKYTMNVFHNTLGFGSAEMIRRVIGVAHVEDFKSIEEANKALRVFQKPNVPTKLQYKFAPDLIMFDANETVETWMTTKDLCPRKLIQAMMHFPSGPHAKNETHEVIKYLEYCVHRLQNANPGVQNLLLSLYAKQEDESTLMCFLQYKFGKGQPNNLEFLRFEGILQFFPYFALIDDFKEAIRSSWEDYNTFYDPFEKNLKLEFYEPIVKMKFVKNLFVGAGLVEAVKKQVKPLERVAANMPVLAVVWLLGLMTNVIYFKMVSMQAMCSSVGFLGYDKQINKI